ncbi:unnamed protein product, partial [marine sediment metagenome]
LENILSSVAIASLYGIEAGIIREALIEFKGLPHRAEWVGEVEGVEFINDSKATNEDAVRSSLEFRNKKTILIMGGKDKGADFSSLKKVVGEKVRKLILLGEAKRNIRNQLNGICPIEEVEDKDSTGCRDTLLHLMAIRSIRAHIINPSLIPEPFYL